ncbi:hypothetical protein K469DRAFT_565841 [Zopfia rhizophila CBS 207.26]|uniref:Extracellular mutant protein 11 C-terminal domain-containing protein n=1 Tax=Zopfia rhizophila CBS 207.26 TaxID=1314779 RepID=A0A6A6EFG2_9PEZI|nr:hypothetical protein K469DRAFT_565841 [Zopfia rhizophila CBS 207.26]
MRTFVGRGGRANSPQLRQSNSTTDRRAIAANAKVRTSRTVLSHQEPVQQHPSVLRHHGGHNDLPVMQQQQQPYRDHVKQQKRDAYDTDADSIDTTLPRQSEIQVQASQKIEPGYEDEYGEEEEEEEENDGDESEDGNEEDGEDQEQDYYEDQGIHDEALRRMQQADQAQGFDDMFGGGTSYPTTTSGIPDNFPEGYVPGQEVSSEYHGEEGDGSPSPQRPPVKEQQHRQITQEQYRPISAPEKAHPTHNPPTIYQKGAAVRTQHRTDTKMPVRQGPPQQPIPQPVLSSQSPTYSQDMKACQHTHVQNDAPLPQRSAKQIPSPSRIQETKPVEPPPVITSYPVLNRHVEEDRVVGRDPKHPLEDYDRPALFQMPYELLKNEEFDFVPRAIPSVLSDDMLQKPLTDRLEYVQRTLEPDDQAKFFSSLPTHEWEDSGDWFLDQFGGIITRMKEARQNKRKLAREFEDEVEKRHRHVAKKQAKVEDAMGKMKNQGQGLILRTPKKNR